MAIKIGSNIASIQAQRRLGEATSSLSKIYEKLSSGKRVNRGSDDAASLAIAESLNASSRIFSQAVRNVNDTVSAVNISASATSAMKDITIRKRELAQQSANGTYSSKQRDALNKESRELTNEYNRIIETTSFNGQKLLANPWDTLTTQLGIGAEATIGYKLSLIHI